MKFQWLIQDTDRKISDIDKEYNTLLSMNEKYLNFGIIKNSNIITGIDDISLDTICITRCSVKFIKLIRDNLIDKDKHSLLSKSISYDKLLFDQAHYGTLNLPLVNHNAEIMYIKDCLFTSFGKDKFIKPTTDLKAFNAGILEERIPVKCYVENVSHQPDYMNETILIGDIVNIQEEYRFFCIEDNLITGSQYAKNGLLFIDKTIPVQVKDIAKEYVKLYKPSDIFVMDIGKTDRGYKIIEYNCWNASGLYESDQIKLFSEIKNYFVKNNL